MTSMREQRVSNPAGSWNFAMDASGQLGVCPGGLTS
jgi:hypothetical protein